MRKLISTILMTVIMTTIAVPAIRDNKAQVSMVLDPIEAKAIVGQISADCFEDFVSMSLVAGSLVFVTGGLGFAFWLVAVAWSAYQIYGSCS